MRVEELVNDTRIRGVCISPDIKDTWVDLRKSYDDMALLPQQTHSLNVRVVEPGVTVYPETDALVSFEPSSPVGVMTADCVPILLYAPDIMAVAAVHAGWKGTLGGIIDNTVNLFIKYGASAGKMTVFFGPSISMRNYEVDRDLACRFIDAGFDAQIYWPGGKSAKPHLDLQGMNVARLVRCGVDPDNISLHHGCTYDSADTSGHFLYQSYRRSNGDPARNLTYIALK